MVIREGAAKAEVMAAVTHNGRNDPVELSSLYFAVDCIHAVRCRTPFEILQIIHVCPGKQFMVARMSAYTQDKIGIVHTDL